MEYTFYELHRALSTAVAGEKKGQRIRRRPLRRSSRPITVRTVLSMPSRLNLNKPSKCLDSLAAYRLIQEAGEQLAALAGSFLLAQVRKHLVSRLAGDGPHRHHTCNRARGHDFREIGELGVLDLRYTEEGQ